MNYSFSNSSLGFLTDYGKITFLQNINGSGENLSSDIRMNTNFAFVNSSQTNFNKSANVTLYNLPTNFTNPSIFKDGLLCSDCFAFC